MIGTSVFVGFALYIIVGILLPVGAACVYKIKTKESLKPVLVGALIFFVFAIILESIPKYFLLLPNNPLGTWISGNTLVYMIVVALLAGIFEETGRLVGFKFLLKKFLDKRTAIGYGIGHGGFEVIYILVLGGINNIVYAFLINTNQFDAVISEAAAKAPEQAAALMAIPESLAAITFGTILMGILERVSAMLIHISCSIIMFKAVREAGKMWLFPIAILLHASIDMIAAMYQCGLISNIYIIEAILVIWSVALILVTYNVVYKKMGSVSEKQ